MELKATGERLLVSVETRTVIEHLHRYAVALAYVKDKVVLDIASGEGYGSSLLAGSAKFVYGVDIAADAIRHAQSKYKSDNIRFVEGSATAIPIEDTSVDVIVSFETIEHLDEHTEMMKEFKRVLRPGGVVVISSPDKKYYSDINKFDNEFHVKELYTEEFVELLKRFFINVSLFKQGMLTGSLIYPDTQNGGAPFNVYNGNFLNVMRSAHIAMPQYNIIIASDAALQETGISFFESGLLDTAEKRYTEAEKELHGIKSSQSFKAGELMALPVRFVKQLFRKKK